MPSLLVERRSWATKPTTGVQINWGHPLAQGLALCVPFSERIMPRELVHGIQGALTPGTGSALVNLNSSRRAPGFGLCVSGQGFLGLGNDGVAPLNGLSTTSCTIMIAKNKLSANAASTAITIGTTNQVNCHLPYSDGNIYWDFGGATSPNRLTVAGLTFGDDIWHLIAGTRGSSVWQNGVLRGSQSTPITRTIGGGFAFGGLATLAGETDSRYGLFYMWNRELLASEIQWLNVQPYAFLIPPAPSVERFSLAAIAAGGNIKTIDGIPIAQVKTIDGIAIASVKTIDGIPL